MVRPSCRSGVVYETGERRSRAWAAVIFGSATAASDYGRGRRRARRSDDRGGAGVVVGYPAALCRAAGHTGVGLPAGFKHR